MNIKIIKEAYRGVDKEEHTKVLASARKIMDTFQSARRTPGTIDQRTLRAKAGTDPQGLLSQLGINSVDTGGVPTSNIKSAIDNLLAGTKADEFSQLFLPSEVELVKTASTLGVYIPMTNEAKSEIGSDPKLAREIGFWFYSTVLASNKAYEILNKIKMTQLRVDYSASGFIIYLARISWNKL